MPLTSLDPELKISSLWLVRDQIEVTIGSVSNKQTSSLPKILFSIFFSLLKNFVDINFFKKRERTMNGKE